jgi:hypothetical protein
VLQLCVCVCVCVCVDTVLRMCVYTPERILDCICVCVLGRLLGPSSVAPLPHISPPPSSATPWSALVCRVSVPGLSVSLSLAHATRAHTHTHARARAHTQTHPASRAYGQGQRQPERVERQKVADCFVTTQHRIRSRCCVYVSEPLARVSMLEKNNDIIIIIVFADAREAHCIFYTTSNSHSQDA